MFETKYRILIKHRYYVALLVQRRFLGLWYTVKRKEYPIDDEKYLILSQRYKRTLGL